ncbi:hypothetical protein LWC05_03475 [Acetobacter sicerae]|uniref:TtsA-like Glycoside hydrolase family 108 domain-containing protein n=1 Tax=Acetobacter sicerae TaxID=85325 RepID=A0ABS8VQG5_9PROT|nr:glycosyl hydrolase 108 family protein [Acetobacter sicerae]MCE0742952.1 hypothetical protein [Acetobacter sicerae]NHN91382.1 hypothetical protein [Acetobacter sicerae]
MTGQNFDACLDFVRTAEGGYSEDPKDLGNWLPAENGRKGVLIGSHYGVSAAMLASWKKPQPVSQDDMRNLDLDTFDAIARSRFWNPLVCSALPAGLDLMVFDFGWNCGVSASARLLQRMVGVTMDGCIGPQTLSALNHMNASDLLPQIDPDNLAALHARLGLPPSSGIGPEVRRALESQQTMGLLLVLVLSGMQEREYRVRAGFRRWGRGWLARTKRRTETALALVVAARGREAGPAMF